VIDKTVTRLTVGASLVKDFRAYLFEMDPRRLATVLIGGWGARVTIRPAPPLADAGHDGTDRLRAATAAQLDFTRDSSSWIYNGVSLNPMYFEARQLEVVHVAAIYNWTRCSPRPTSILVPRSGRAGRFVQEDGAAPPRGRT